MNNNRNREIIVGIVAVVAIILFIIGLGWGNGWSSSNSRQELKIRFSTSGGIKLSAPVHINGVKRGRVENIVNENGTVLITASVDGISDLKADASAKILILEITGGKKIEINPGISNDIFNIKNEINGTTAADLGELIEIVGEVSDDAVSLLRRLDTISVSVNNILSDEELINDLRFAIKQTNDFVGNANKLLVNNKTEIAEIIENINSLSMKLDKTFDKYEPSIGEIIDELKITLNRTKGLFRNADSSIIKMNGIFEKVDKLLLATENDSSAIYKLFYDKQFTENLDSALINLSNILLKFNEYGVNVNVRLGSRP